MLKITILKADGILNDISEPKNIEIYDESELVFYGTLKDLCRTINVARNRQAQRKRTADRKYSQNINESLKRDDSIQLNIKRDEYLDGIMNRAPYIGDENGEDAKD